MQYRKYLLNVHVYSMDIAPYYQSNIRIMLDRKEKKKKKKEKKEKKRKKRKKKRRKKRKEEKRKKRNEKNDTRFESLLIQKFDFANKAIYI